MKTVDCFGREVRLTDERLAHILERAELRDMRDEIKSARCRLRQR
jgi:hypothetical protein